MASLGDLLTAFLEATGQGALHQKNIADRGGNYMAQDRAANIAAQGAALNQQGEVAKLSQERAMVEALAKYGRRSGATTAANPDEAAAEFQVSEKQKDSELADKIKQAQIELYGAQAGELGRRPSTLELERLREEGRIKLEGEKHRGDMAEIAARLAGMLGNRQPQITVVTGPQGQYRLNKQTGQMEPIMMPGGGTQLPPSMNATERKESAGGNVMLEDADRLIELSNEPAVQAAIGPWAGLVTTVKRATVGVPSDVNEAARTSQNLSDQLLRLRSGAQINEQEYRRLSKLVPNINQPVSTFQDNLRLFRSELARTLAYRFQGGFQDPNTRGVATDLPGGGFNSGAGSGDDVVSDLPGGGWTDPRAAAAPQGGGTNYVYVPGKGMVKQ